jgi:hypothetical protein
LLFFAHGAFATGTGDAGPPVPGRMLRAVPNPSSGRVTFLFEAPLTRELAVVVYDSRGREVARVSVAAGAEAAAWAPPDGAASGVYLARLEAAGEVLAAAAFTRLR